MSAYLRFMAAITVGAFCAISAPFVLLAVLT